MKHQETTVAFSHDWSRPYLPIGGMKKVYVLVEARGTGSKRVDRSAINMSLVLDRSGSMSGEPLHFSKKACQFVVDQMGAGDVFSLVSFDDEVRTVVAPSKLTRKNAIKQRIESIRTGGSTNLSGGLIEGAQHVQSGKGDGMVNRVILLSDGHANEGITDREKLFAIAREYRSAGVGITTMGVGDGFDEELMEGIAEHGGGNFHYIGTPDQIPTIFQEELVGLLTVVVQNMRLSMWSTEHCEIKNVFGYKSDDLSGGCVIQAGDLYHDEVKTILIELNIQPHSLGTHPVLTLQWDYTDVTEGAVACTYTSELLAEFTNDRKLLGMLGSEEVRKQVTITESAKAIEAAMEAMDNGDVQAGKQMLREQADHMMVMSAELGAPVLFKESQQLFDQLENFEYSSKTRKELHAQKYRQMKRKE